MPLGSLSPDLVITGPDNLFIELICPLEQEVRQEVGRIIWHVLAQIDQTFGQVRHHLIHKVLPDWLRSLVKQVALVLTDRLEFGCVTLLSLDAVSLGICIEKLFLFSLELGALVLLLLTLDQKLDFVNLFLRFLLSILGFLSCDHLLLLLLGQVLILHDFEMGHRARVR